MVNEAWATQGGKITRDMRALVRQYVEDSFFEGLLDGGASPDQLTVDDRALIDTLALEQLQYVSQFSGDVADAAGDFTQQDSIRRRISLWAESIFKVGQRGWAQGRAKTKRRIQWHTVGEGEELVCPICAPLNDKIIFAGEEFAPGIYNEPAHPNCRCTTTEYVEALDFA